MDNKSVHITAEELGIFLSCMEPTLAYNLPLLLPLGKGSFDKAKKAVDSILANHPYLFMRLHRESDGEIYKSVEPFAFELKAEDFDLAKKESLVEPFELIGSPLFRIRYLKTKDGDYLFSDFHHVLMDGFSLKMYLDEFAAAYDGSFTNVPEAFTCIDDAQEKADVKANADEMKAHEDYFMERFGGLDVDSSLVEDKKDEAVGYGRIRVDLPSVSDKDVAKTLKQYGIHRSAFFLGAYALTLAQATFLEEVFFLTVNNGRSEKVKRSFGMYVKTLPFHIDHIDQGGIADFLKKIDAQQQDSIAHSAFSYSDFVAKNGVTAENLFAYQGDYFYHAQIGGKDVPVEVIQTKDGKEKMAIELFRNGDGYFADVEYRSDLYEEDTIVSFVKRLEHFALQLMQKDNLEDIDPTSKEDLALVDSYNDQDISYLDLNHDFMTRIEEHFKNRADKVAISALDRSITYGELDDLTARVADYIISKGYKPNQVVSLLIGRNANIAPAALGVLRAGLGYQPLDPEYPEERLNFMVQDSDAVLVIADRGLESRLSEYKGEFLFTDEIAALPHLDLPRPTPKGTDLFIMLYTSGSTGKPKGVELMRRNISAYLQWQIDGFHITEDSIFFTYASFGFDASVHDMYGAWYNGIPVHVIGEDIRLDLKAMEAFINERGCTHGIMTTQVGRQFAELCRCPALRYLKVGGEKLVPVEPPKDYTLINAYGPSENMIEITNYVVDKLYYRVPIGRGFSTTHLYVLDKKMRRLPYGVPGYLYSAGPQIGRCYKNRPEENAKAFLENPFDDGMWKPMYYTGDVVRFLKDGNVDFIGRKDGQVKIRGFRIEMSEVEKVIRAFDGVKDATVNAYPAPSGGSFLVGYVVSDQKLDLEAIKAFILERKPYYMCPEIMMQIDAIPLNQNSKVNKRALPLPKREKKEVIAPKNDNEKKIYDVAVKVLGYDEVSTEEDLFNAGLTSISSIRFITLVSDALGVECSAKTLRDNPTIAKLAANLSPNEEVVDENLADYPLTATQKGIYVECVSHPDSTIYNIPLLYRLDKSVDIRKLTAAIKTAIDAHPYLKGHLCLDENGDPRMFADKEAPVKVKILQGDVGSDLKPAPYDLMKGPFYQARIYKGESNYLYLDTHHIASDGSALAVLLEDINNAYAGKEILPEKRDGFAIALKEEKDATKEAKEKEKAYYASFLDGVDSPSLPRKEYDLDAVAKPLESDFDLAVSKDKVKAFLKENHINLGGFFNAVFAYTLAKWNGNEDALFATVYSGRDSSYTSRSITMMVKTLPVYAKVDNEMAALDFVKAVSAQVEQSEQSTLYSFAEIAHDFGVKADVLFAYQGDGFLPNEIGEKPAELIHLNGDEPKADFSVDCIEGPECFKMHYEFASNLFRPETTKYFSRMFDQVILGFLDNKKLGDIALCDEQTIAELDVYNQTDDISYPTTYVDMFRDQVKANPDKLAVIGIDESITYKEMALRTNKVARAMLELGVKADDKIIVMMPRIANAYVAREGVLKSGAAFVPVDPAYPDDRILYILEDSEAKAILTTKKLYEEKKQTYGNAHFILMEDILASKDDSDVNVPIARNSLAYCIYTSGSTGKPKGVMIEHHSLANYVYGTEQKNPIIYEFVKLSHVALALASLSFDLSIEEEFAPLANGLSVVIASEDEILNPVLLAKRMKQHKVDILTTTPSYVNNILEIEEVVDAFRDLKVIELGAEALPASMIAKMRDRGLNGLIANGYGPTEATVACTMDFVESSRITIGFPMNNVKTYIIDSKLNRLPFGAVGELLIGGEGVARGYIHRDDLTKEKFIDYHGVYSYKSGDLARINYDGRIEFFGRKDNQVKLRGLRVELDEIENNMQTYPGISRAVVVVKETKEEGQFLVGYYLSKEEVSTDELKAHLAKTLTPYMIPKVFMRLEAIPMTNNGKVNKKALPDPVLTKESKSGVRKPRNKTQEILLDIFQHVLGMDQISIDDDFFDLGGTSLSASKVTMLAMGKGLNISYSDVFDNPTVVDLAAIALANGHKQDEQQEEAVQAEEGLECNSIAHVDEISQNLSEFDSILLTGATGFLGIHIFHELLENSDCKVTVLVRGSADITGKERLQGLLEYYFDSPYEDEMEHRVRVIEDDVTNANLVDALKGVEFSLIINCAAVVKHFSNSDVIEQVNLGGVKNLIEVALDHKVRLVQVSTLSVAGENLDHKFPSEKRIHENEIFFGQDISNKYIHSKIGAEQAIIEAVNKRGLDGKIVRVGNLMGRARDGEFQVNSSTNNFMASIRAYKKLGAFPISAADGTIDFSPIDEVSKTILLLAKTDKKFTIFHSANSHEVELGDVIAAMNAAGFKIDMVDDATFAKMLEDCMQDESRNMDVSCLISYNSSDTVAREYILSDNSFTIKALYRLGYKWPITDARYLERSIASLSTLGFFD